MVEAKRNTQTKGSAWPLSEVKHKSKGKVYTDPNNLLSLFLNKHNIADYEEVA